MSLRRQGRPMKGEGCFWRRNGWCGRPPARRGGASSCGWRASTVPGVTTCWSRCSPPPLNLIHRDDAAGAILACLESKLATGTHVFNAADDAPAPKAEVAGWLARELGVPTPLFTGAAHPARRAVVPDRVVMNAELRRQTGWRPRFSNYREGYESILSHGTDAAQSGDGIT